MVPALEKVCASVMQITRVNHVRLRFVQNGAPVMVAASPSRDKLCGLTAVAKVKKK